MPIGPEIAKRHEGRRLFVFLQRMHWLLVTGGFLVMRAPNIWSFMIWSLGPHHRHFTPEKDMSFTPKTFCQLVKEAGFVGVIHLRTFGREVYPVEGARSRPEWLCPRPVRLRKVSERDNGAIPANQVATADGQGVQQCLLIA